MNYVSRDWVDDMEGDFTWVACLRNHHCKEIWVDELVEKDSFFAKDGWEDVLLSSGRHVLSDHLFYDVVIAFFCLVSFFRVGRWEVDVPDLLRFESATVDLEPRHRTFLLINLSIEELLVSMELGACWEDTNIKLVFSFRSILRHCNENLAPKFTLRNRVDEHEVVFFSKLARFMSALTNCSSNWIQVCQSILRDYDDIDNIIKASSRLNQYIDSLLLRIKISPDNASIERRKRHNFTWLCQQNESLTKAKHFVSQSLAVCRNAAEIIVLQQGDKCL